eukprot:g75551.t1
MGGDVLLWPDKRHQRQEWKERLQKTVEILSAPRKPLDGETKQKILSGLAQDLKLQDASAKIRVFVSSTFTDTEYERNQLMRDVYPYLQKLCQALGIEWGTVDMRWGVLSSTGLEHGTTEMCLSQLRHCLADSVGPAFLLLHGNKYGYRPLPTTIATGTLHAILTHLEQLKEDCALLKTWYLLDENEVPAVYVLKPRTAGDDAVWWPAFERMQRLLRKGATVLDADTRRPFIISVTEHEIDSGVFHNQNRGVQAYYFTRNFDDAVKVLDKSYWDMDTEGKQLDQEAAQLLEEVKQHARTSLPDPNRWVAGFHIKRDVTKVEAQDEKEHQQYLRNFCDTACRKLADGIVSAYQAHLHAVPDPVFEEVVRQRRLCLLKIAGMVQRQSLLDQIQTYLTSENENAERKALVVHGISGSGKTALMAKAISTVPSSSPPAVVVYRFLGTSAASGTAWVLLESLIAQLRFLLQGAAWDGVLAHDFSALVEQFQQAVSAFQHKKQRLILFLDSLDQLSDANGGRELQWLPGIASPLPPYVSLVVSTLPDVGACFKVCSRFVPASNFVEVPVLSEEDGPLVLDSMLSSAKRTVTPAQHGLIMSSFRKTPTPLFLRLAVDRALRWRSWMSPQTDPEDVSVPATVVGCVQALFQRLEKKHGQVLVQRALGLITASKHGLSCSELEDALSIDDTVLAHVFEWWTPPERRIPPLLWLRIREDLGDYLMEVGAGQVTTYRWYHRQFWQEAELRYLHATQAGQDELHNLLAEYFLDKWIEGKPVPGSESKEKPVSRLVAAQPLVFGGVRDPETGLGRVLNLRKLQELPHHLMQAGERQSSARAALFRDLAFIEACFEAGYGHSFLSLLGDIASKSAFPEEERKVCQQLGRFLASNLGALVSEPCTIYQLASQLPNSSLPYRLLSALDQGALPKAHLVQLDKPDQAEVCLLTLFGHKDGVSSCSFNRNDQLLATASRDNTVRIWSAATGAEVATVKNYSEYATHTGGNCPSEDWRLRPVEWSPQEDVLAVGCVNGPVKLLDAAGNVIRVLGAATGYATGSVCFSSDGKLLIAASDDGTARVWRTASGETVTQLTEHTRAVVGVALSPDGKLAATGSQDGYVFLYQVESWRVRHKIYVGVVTSSLQFSPDSKILAGACWNCKVYLWHVDDPNQRREVSHLGWNWKVDFSRDGRYLLSASSDRFAKLWEVSSGREVNKIPGHAARVSWAHYSNDRSRIVTCSLDMSIKIWDAKVVESGVALSEGEGGFFGMLVASPARDLLIGQQGFGKCFDIRPSPQAAIARSSNSHRGIPSNVRFFPDGASAVSLCEGNNARDGKGHGTVGMYGMKSGAKVFDVTEQVPGKPFGLAVHPNGSEFAVCNDVGQVVIFSKYLPDGTLVVSHEDVLRCFAPDTKTGEQLASPQLTVQCGGRVDVLVSAPALSSRPGQLHLAVGTRPAVEIWVLEQEGVKLKAALLRKLYHSAQAKGIGYSSSGQLCYSYDGLAVRLYDTARNYMNTHTLFSSVGAVCLWGKQEEEVVVGTASGSLLRFTHSMDLAAPGEKAT